MSCEASSGYADEENDLEVDIVIRSTAKVNISWENQPRTKQIKGSNSFLDPLRNADGQGGEHL